MALEQNIVVLIGGVGGAKLASGLVKVFPSQRLTFIVNTGDDFWHMGLRICPDLDTVMYTLRGLVDPQWGWGIKDDTVATLESLSNLYQVEPWFRLGDKDLATHLLRTELLRQGKSLTEVTTILRKRLGIGATVLPMCDSEVPTMIDTIEAGELGFQEYFVKRRWQPTVKAIRHAGCESAAVSAAVRSALTSADLILIAPSNPWLSVEPILSIPGMRELLTGLAVPAVAITPIIAGDAVKGPTAKIMRELGLEVSAQTIVSFYHGIINAFVDDIRNESLQLDGVRIAQFNTFMIDAQDKRTLARDILAWVAGWPT